MGIAFGQGQHRFDFSDPVPLDGWVPPRRAGLYAILLPDRNARPLPYRVIYFGESGNMDDRGFSTHHARMSWMLEAAASGGGVLHVATMLWPNSTPEDRRAVERYLCNLYRPDCNG